MRGWHGSSPSWVWASTRPSANSRQLGTSIPACVWMSAQLKRACTDEHPSWLANGSKISSLISGCRCLIILDSEDSKYRNCNSTNSLIHNRFLVWKIRFKTSHYLLWFFGRVEILAIGFWKIFPNFEILDAKIASAVNKIIKNLQF